ncbi:MAG: GNAT family N-acetyltransferase [Fidelibacterota bacterium]
MKRTPRSEEKGFQELDVNPVTADHWSDLEKLFGEKGACGGCWCMWMRLTRSEFQKLKGEGNKEAMRTIVRAGEVPGLLAYDGGEPVAWCSVAPREQFPVLDRSRILKPIDDTPVWSVVCFFVERSHRNRGITVQLLNGAKDYVRRQGGGAIEGYPVEPKRDRIPPPFAWTGIAAAFRRAGFTESLRRSDTRPIMRFYLNDEESR